MERTLETHVDKAEIESWLASLEPPPETSRVPPEAFDPEGGEQPEGSFERALTYGDLLDLRDDFAALGEQVATSEDLSALRERMATKDDLRRTKTALREENRKKDLELYATIRAELHRLRVGLQADIKQVRVEICRDFRAELASHVGALEQRLIERIDQRAGTAS